MAFYRVLKAGFLASLFATALPVARGEPGARNPLIPEAQGLALRVVERGVFCSQLASVFVEYGQRSGYDRVQTTLLATGATATVVEEFRAGRASDFINTAALAAFTATAKSTAPDTYLPLAGILGRAMGLEGGVDLALSVAELRFIAFAERNKDLVVVAANAAGLTPERAKRVSTVARANGIRLHVIWVGGAMAKALTEAESLAWLAATTGGGFAHLGGTDNPCASAS